VKRLGADFRVALDFLMVIGTASHIEEFADLLIRGLPHLILKEIISCVEADTEHRGTYFRSNPAGTIFKASERIVERSVNQGPTLLLQQIRAGIQ
jgi:hypothetical protein